MRRTRTRICNMRIGLCNIGHFTVSRSDSRCEGIEPTFRRTGRCLLVSIAVGGLLLTHCGAFDAHLPLVRCRPWGANTGDIYARCPGSTSARAARASKIMMTTTTTSKTIREEEVKTAKYLGETSPEDLSMWEGHEYGFDWYLERTRRRMAEKGGGFSPLRMTFWRPMEEQPEELTPWDSFYIMLRNLGQIIGLPSVDNAPVAKIETYKGSWWTFLQKVSNGRLEDLAGGPLFLMLEKYFRAEGEMIGHWRVHGDLDVCSCRKWLSLTFPGSR